MILFLEPAEDHRQRRFELAIRPRFRFRWENSIDDQDWVQIEALLGRSAG